MAFLKTSLRILSILILFLFNSANIYSQDYALESIKTYEGPYGNVEVDYRNYQSTFDKNNTRFIWCEVNLTNNLYLQRQQSHNVEWKFYKPDGSPFGNLTAVWTIKIEWASTHMERSFGWNEAGNWDPGKYSVDFFIDGKYLASVSFFITGTNYDSPTISYKSIRFFESSDVVPDLNNRSYSTTFPQRNARYIYYEIYVDNLLYNVSDNYVTLDAVYYKPNQEIFGQITWSGNVLKDWSTAYIHHGFGWKAQGNWDPGNYYVEIKYKNKIIATGYFTITNN